jgi:aminopeptidase N
MAPCRKRKALPNHFKLTHWKESVPLAPKIMVIGVADFAVDHPGDAMGIPVWNYVFRKINR